MRILNDIKTANEHCESFTQRVALWYKVLIGLLFSIPLLFIVGFITGLLLASNPLKAGVAAVDGLF